MDYVRIAQEVIENVGEKRISFPLHIVRQD